jgi:hypothetical protein
VIASTPASSLSTRLRALAISISVLLVCVAVAAVCARRANRLRASWPPEVDTYYLPPSPFLKAVSVGHNELAADLIHARANVYFGTQLHARVPTHWLANYLNAAMDLDPKFERLYLAGAAMLIYNGQRISPDMVLAAIQVLKRGHKAFPFDWEYPFQIGFNYLFELPQDAGEDDPRVPSWRQLGVDSLRQAALFQGIPYYVPSLVARMLTQQGGVNLAIRHLEQAYAVATNPEARTQIRNKLVSLHAQSASALLEEGLRAHRRMIEERFPYAPEAFSVIVGERRIPTKLELATELDQESPGRP